MLVQPFLENVGSAFYENVGSTFCLINIVTVLKNVATFFIL
jgi:hypothetical protein